MADPSTPFPMHWTPRVAKSAAEEAALKRHPKVFELSYPAMLRSSVMEILERDLGLDASAQARKGVLGDGQPIPLMSYAFIEYIMSLDLSDLVVLEIGGGNSTMFWARRAKSVLTFEHNRDWHDDVKGQIPSNVDLQFINRDDYVPRVRALDARFDLIVIDCGANRYECAKAADGKLATGGMVVLDNSDWYPNTAAALRAQDLIQIDFPDFRPDHWYRSCTSIFIHPEFRPKPRTGQLPPPVLGGKDLTKDNKWDRPF